jgi:hypothetical protein
MKHIKSCEQSMCFEPKASSTEIDTLFEKRNIVDEFKRERSYRR